MANTDRKGARQTAEPAGSGPPDFLLRGIGLGVDAVPVVRQCGRQRQPVLVAQESCLAVPLRLGGHKVDDAWFDALVGALRIGDRLRHRPSELSGGQQQRVAAARAMIARPDLIFADEPTGNLDSRSATEMLEMTRAAVAGFGQTVVMVTHDARAASYADRVVFLADGRIVESLRGPTMERILDQLKRLGA